MRLSLPKRFPLFILASSLQCLISTLTQEGNGGHFFRLVQSSCGEGGTLQTNITGVCGECSQCFSCTGFAPAHSGCVCFHGVYFSGSRLLCQELSEAGPGLHALPRSKPLRFSFSGNPQGHRLGCACVLCPSQVQAAQATRYSVSTLSQVGHVS